MPKVVETLLYTLKPGTGAEFDRIMRDISVPLHQRIRMDVVAYGNSLHDPDAYFLIRSYDSLEHRQVSQDAFYRSEDWRAGPRAAIIERIATSVNVVVDLPPDAVDVERTPF
ncbi:NIPSNAP family protein [Aureimonas pseudogalii]|uniref:NIPSNAP domain-containing protein n=1 Tax=Aureimonas pseudogalii TaxID=1744844 RepID=A0A7W6MME8_9HYPH|nr:NIPSNAP family protein [Aureimonas pseudogalii]MBB4000765.1 hypothetical protein [Aureimonas pseudogalii]